MADSTDFFKLVGGVRNVLALGVTIVVAVIYGYNTITTINDNKDGIDGLEVQITLLTQKIADLQDENATQAAELLKIPQLGQENYENERILIEFQQIVQSRLVEMCATFETVTNELHKISKDFLKIETSYKEGFDIANNDGLLVPGIDAARLSKLGVYLSDVDTKIETVNARLRENPYSDPIICLNVHNN